MDIIERLLEDAVHHDDISTQCDCRPEDTVNHDHAVNAREAAKEIEKLRKTLHQILVDAQSQDVLFEWWSVIELVLPFNVKLRGAQND